jgi:hypothetical protein
VADGTATVSFKAIVLLVDYPECRSAGRSVNMPHVLFQKPEESCPTREAANCLPASHAAI